MPICTITRDPNVVSDDEARNLATHLQVAVAQAMHVVENEKFHLTVDEVEVRIRDVGRLDLNSSPLGIEIVANYCPEREADLDGRLEMIYEAIWDHAPAQVLGEAYIYPRLQIGSFKVL